MKTVLLKQLEFLTSYQTGFISSWERMVIFCSPPCGLTCLDFRRHRNIPSSRIERSNGRVLFRKALHLHVFRDLWQWHPTPILLPGKSHGWRSLVAAVHGVMKSRTRLSDFTFTFHFHASEKEMAAHSSILAWRIPGTGAWWAAIYGVTQSRTRLKRLSSSSRDLWGLLAQLVKNPPAMQETLVRFLGQEVPLEQG